MRITGLLLALLAAMTLPAQTGKPAAARPLVLAHVMPWFEAKNGWGWHWTMDKFDPFKGQLAAHVHPWNGAYDSSDARVIEYQVLLMKVAGIDGAIIDWNGLGGFDDYASIHRNTLLLIAELKKAGLRFAICAEDNPGQRLVKQSGLARPLAVEHLRTSLHWLDQHWLTDPAYVKIGGQPVLFIFGPQFLNETEWVAIRGGMKANPLTFALPHLSGMKGIDGAFAWIPVSEGKAVSKESYLGARAGLYATQAHGAKVVAVAFPGYHDIYAQAGQGKSYGFIDPQGGVTFTTTLDQAMKSGAPIVQLATWNDYGEGTVIEPTQEAGFQYLEQVMRQLRPGQDTSPLSLPRIIYENRPWVLAAGPSRAHDAELLDQAVQWLQVGNLTEAKAVLGKIKK